MNFRQNSTEPSELVFGIIGPIGCNRKLVIDTMKNLASHYSYKAFEMKVSEIIAEHCTVPDSGADQYKRVTNLMTAGNELRRQSGDNSLLAKLTAFEISKSRSKNHEAKRISIIDSIKHPEEVEELRSIYGPGFYLFAVHSSQEKREAYLKNECRVFEKTKRQKLIDRDKDEKIGHGQSTSDAFHLADFFLTEEGDNTKVWNTLERFFDIIFSHPFKTPTFHEYSMYMAYGSSMRSADMSRQVGAVVTTGTDIISTGANECPRPFGGTYWPVYDYETSEINDVKNGRDYMNGVDRNGKEKHEIINAIVKGVPEEWKTKVMENINSSGLNDISEYGRVVHAEMDALLGCARRGISCDGGTIFCTTFPCHNCAKHIIASGIKKMVYIEPYPKSKAHQMHPDAIRAPDDKEFLDRVLFVPFVGVGPRQFVNLFSMQLSFGEKIRRKKKGSYEIADWERSTARPRLKMFPVSYIDNESTVIAEAINSLQSIPRIIIK